MLLIQTYTKVCGLVMFTVLRGLFERNCLLRISNNSDFEKSGYDWKALFNTFTMIDTCSDKISQCVANLSFEDTLSMTT